MNRTLVLATLLASGLATTTLVAQTAPAAAAPAPAAAAPAAPAPPQAIPAKVAIIAFEQVAGGTNEGQKLVADLRKKYEPKNTELQNRANELDSLKKQLQALPPATPDEERAKRMKDIDSKDKRLQQDAQDLQQEEQGDFQDGFSKLMQKVGPVAVKYASDNGFTLLLNTGSGQELPTVLWWNQSTDISQAVVNAYNVSSGIAAPPPSAPSPTVHRTTPPASTTPKKQ